MPPQDFDDEAFDTINQPINETKIQTELANVAAYIAFYGQMEQRWIETHDNLDYQLDKASAQAGRDHRNTAAKSSEGTVKEAILLDEKCDKLARAMLKTKAQKSKYGAAVKALEARLKALQSMNSNKKAEVGNVYSGGIVSDRIAMGPRGGAAAMPSTYYETSVMPLSASDEFELAKSAKIDSDRKAEILKMLEEANNRRTAGLADVKSV